MKLRILSVALVVTVFLLPGCKQADSVPAKAEKKNTEAFEKKKPRVPLSELMPKAEQGDAQSQTMVAMMYYQGDRVAKDYQEAFKWFKKAAEQENSWAQYMLGMMYQGGEGVKQNNIQARMWFKRAREYTKKLTPQQKKAAKELRKKIREDLRGNKAKELRKKVREELNRK